MEQIHHRNVWDGVVGLEPWGALGWNSDHRWLSETIAEHKPQIIVEIGAWKGASVATMARKIRELGLNSVVIAVDTWLGSSEHWISRDYSSEDDQCLYDQFHGHIVSEKLTDYVVPLRLDSLNAARLLRQIGITPWIDLIHLDAGHDYHSVNADLNAWWPVLQDGGVLLCDDYWRSGQWPEVKQAIDDFLPTVGVTTIEAMDGKCRVRKMAA